MEEIDYKARRAKLVEALRSGKYKQEKGALHRDELGYCCLGVACEISGLGTWVGANVTDQSRVMSYKIDGALTGYSVLPELVREYYGFSSDNGTFLNKDVEDALSALNDMGVRFDAIADIIESEPEWLFLDSHSGEDE